jgi:hypothetical protein
MLKHFFKICVVISLLCISNISYGIDDGDNSIHTLIVKGLKTSDSLYVTDFTGNIVTLNTKQYEKFVPTSETLEIKYTEAERISIGKIRIKKVLSTNEYIERVFELKQGDENYLYMVTLGFFETDREELNNIVTKTLEKLNRDDGSLKEIKVWLMKAIKNVNQTK